MDTRNVFKLKDLNEKFWNQVVTITIQHSSGMGGYGWKYEWKIQTLMREDFYESFMIEYEEYKKRSELHSYTLCGSISAWSSG